jgi:hypothetical protein
MILDDLIRTLKASLNEMEIMRIIAGDFITLCHEEGMRMRSLREPTLKLTHQNMKTFWLITISNQKRKEQNSIFWT